ncbi:MAG: adenylate cyclase [Betaproteobacteria bacterium]|nr:adenylate cyclase [Betaproteobacteria bacterium]
MPFDLKQRLAAILAADAAGYSRLMAADDRATVAALDASRAVFRSQIEANQGRVIDMAGDSVLAVFETAAGAVCAALAVQERLEILVSGAPEERRMRFRIGVHMGDVIEKADGTVYGDGVNIAARLQGLAEPGGITISDAVQGAVRGKVSAAFVDQGEQQVKNIPYPVRAFAVRTDGSAAAPAAASTTRATPPLPDRPSLAVLPFSNLGGDPEQEYFADGMVEEIITALARMGAFFVIARNSSFVYKGKAVDIKQVGRELGVRYVLEGSVRKSGNRVRITGQLIEAESGHHVWADRFEGTLDDVFELQDRITESIVWAIEPSLRRAELERVRVKPTSNLQAYDLLLRALPGLMPGSTIAGKDEAVSFIRRALEMDPHFSMAKALGAFACLQRLADGHGGAEEVKAGLRYAEEALSDNNDNPGILSCAGLALGTLGYRALGFRVLGFRYDEAQRAIERALSLSPNLFIVRFAAGMVGCFVGEGDAAIEHFARAMRLSPLDPGMSALVVGTGLAHVVSGRFEQGLAAAQRTVQESPNFASGHRLMVIALGYLGRVEEAKLAARRMLELAPEFTVSRNQSVSPFKDAEFRKRSAEFFRAAGVPK